MNLAGRSVKLMFVIIIVGMLGPTLGLVGTTSAIYVKYDYMDSTGSGSAGSGSLAVASFFSAGPAGAGGTGAFSGTVGSVTTSGLISLTISNPSNSPVLPCRAGEASTGGSVATGSFEGEQVIVAGCLGSGVPAAFIVYHSTPSSPDFSGQGTGTATVLTSFIKAGFVAAGVTSGSGSAGSGTVYSAEADTVANDRSIMIGGAFLGSFLANVGNTWTGDRASVQLGCTLDTSGITASFGSSPNQPVSSSYTLTTCPPTSSGAQTARFVYVVGGDVSPIYKGAGTAVVNVLGSGFLAL